MLANDMTFVIAKLWSKQTDLRVKLLPNCRICAILVTGPATADRQ
jgi:hypothetical protein